MSEVKRIEGQECLWDEAYVKEADYKAALSREESLKAELAWSENDSRDQSAKIEALQLRLNTADQRNADLEAAILKAKAWSDGEAHERLDEILDAVIGQSAIVTEQVQP